MSALTPHRTHLSEGGLVHRSSARRSEGGFTLIELMAVIAIMAIIVLVAMPALKSLQSTALQTAVRQVSSEMQLARQYAITKRTAVRFAVCVAANNLPDLGSNHVCRAYLVTAATNDADGNVAGWLPVQDWKFLPNGIVFSDHDAGSAYNTLSVDVPPPLASPQSRLYGDAAAGSEWQYFSNSETVTNFVGTTTNVWFVSYVEFSPSGYVGSGSGDIGGIRLMQGVVVNPATPTLTVTDTNNWAYIEYDKYSGRMRTRYRDTYQ